MRRVLLLATMALAVRAMPLTAQAKDPQPFVIEYYYQVKWGNQDEFLRLFKKNHYPVLAKEMADGRIVSVTAAGPRYHATEDGRWDYRVTITFRSVADAFAPSLSEAEMRVLYPDQETFKKEEQRRFEILLAHWDVPVSPVPLP
jgi:hypothetical protein